MKTLTSLMLIELAKTDRAMRIAVRNGRLDIYDQVMQERFAIISDWLDRPTLTDSDYLKLTIY